MKSETVKCRAIFPDVDSSYVLVSFGGNVDKIKFLLLYNRHHLYQ